MANPTMHTTFSLHFLAPNMHRNHAIAISNWQDNQRDTPLHPDLRNSDHMPLPAN